MRSESAPFNVGWWLADTREDIRDCVAWFDLVSKINRQFMEIFRNEKDLMLILTAMPLS